MKEILNKSLVDMAKKYGNTVFFNEREFGVGVSGVFPNRCFDFGLSRRHMALSAVGFCVRGKIPVIFVNEDFVSNVLAEFKMTIAEPNMNVKVVSFGGNDYSDCELIEKLPNVKVYRPKSDGDVLNDFQKMMEEFRPGYLRLEEGTQ